MRGCFALGFLLPALALAESPRVPAALELVENGNYLVVGLERRGGWAVIDTRAGKLLRISESPESITSLAKVDENTLWAVDFRNHEGLLMKWANGDLRVERRVKVPDYPITALADAASGQLITASLWTRTIAAVSPLDNGSLSVSRQTVLPFSPREMLALPGTGKLLVADAFGGQLAVLDLASLAVESVRKIPAHHIRGLAMNAAGDRVLVSHQRLNRLARTSFDDIHWGMALNNAVRALTVTDLLTPSRDLLHQSQLWFLGDVGNAAGDPDAIIPLSRAYQETMVVALAGTGEVAFGSFGEAALTRVETGARPDALVADESRNRLYAASSLNDLITFIDILEKQPVVTISLSPQLSLTAEDRGERLFYNARLSHDAWFSCHSCHTDGHSNGLLADTESDGNFGAPKRIPSLLGLAGTAPFGWLGKFPGIPDQIRSSVATTMHHEDDALTDQEISDLTAYLSQLPPPVRLPITDATAVARGRELFERQECGRCHEGEALTSAKTYDVDLVDEVGNREFNPPSLRGVALRPALFHDGRFTELRDVFGKAGHQLKQPMTEAEIGDLVAYLRTL